MPRARVLFGRGRWRRGDIAMSRRWTPRPLPPGVMGLPSPAMVLPSPVMSRPSPAMGSPSPAMGSPSLVMSRPSPAMSPPSLVMCSSSPVMSRPSPVMAHPSRPLTASSRPLAPPSRPLRTPRGPSRPGHVHIQFGSPSALQGPRSVAPDGPKPASARADRTPRQKRSYDLAPAARERAVRSADVGPGGLGSMFAAPAAPTPRVTFRIRGVGGARPAPRSRRQPGRGPGRLRVVRPHVHRTRARGRPVSQGLTLAEHSFLIKFLQSKPHARENLIVARIARIPELDHEPVS